MSTTAAERSLSDDITGPQPALPIRKVQPVATRVPGRHADQASQASGRRPAPGATPETVRLVQLSCQRLSASEAEFSRTLQRALSDNVPRIRLLAPERSAAMSAGLAHCVLWAALTDDPPEAVAAFLRQVGADHYRQGFPCDAYHDVGRAVLRSVSDSLGYDWDSRLSSAWVSYCHWLEIQFRSGASRAADQAGTPLATPAPEPPPAR